MARTLGKNWKVEISKTYGTAVAIIAMTLAKPPVATATAHAQTNGTAGYLTITSGMTQLEGQAVRADSVSANNMTFNDVDATGYSAWGAGTFTPVTAWESLSDAAGYQKDGGGGITTTISAITFSQSQEEFGGLEAETVQISLGADRFQAAVTLLREIARKGTKAVFRLTDNNGGVRLFLGTPSLPTESISATEAGTGSFSVSVSGKVIELAS